MANKTYIVSEIQKLASPFAEQACCNLWAMTSEIVPQLMEAFWTEKNPEIRATLIYVIAHFRNESAAQFLIEALDDVYDQVWMNALDGLVTIGGKDVMQLLLKFMTRLNSDDIRGAWAMEAIEQISVEAD